MRIRYCHPAVAAAVLVSWLSIGQSSAQTPTGATGQVNDVHGRPTTLIGCIQREVDYRRMNPGRGGVNGSRLGRGTEYALITAFRGEYVLINASRAGSGSVATDIDCSIQSTGETYQLTGDREGDVAPFVGRVVQISGMLENGDVKPVGTSGPAADSFDPLAQDVGLHEIDVTSVHDVSTTAKTATTGLEERRRAGLLPLAGLFGLLLLGGALGLWALRRG